MDKLTKERRSWNMSRILAKDTKPEMMIRSILHGMGYRFRLHIKELPGNPDIVINKYRTAIFVNGCFWHRHEGCKYAYTPKSKEQFWSDKFRVNVERDRTALEDLSAIGWKVLVIWECEISDMDTLRYRLESFFKNNRGVR